MYYRTVFCVSYRSKDKLQTLHFHMKWMLIGIKKKLRKIFFLLLLWNWADNINILYSCGMNFFHDEIEIQFSALLTHSSCALFLSYHSITINITVFFLCLSLFIYLSYFYNFFSSFSFVNWFLFWNKYWNIAIIKYYEIIAPKISSNQWKNYWIYERLLNNNSFVIILFYTHNCTVYYFLLFISLEMIFILLFYDFFVIDIIYIEIYIFNFL